MNEHRASGCGLLLFALLSVVLLAGAWFFTTWRSSDTVLPPHLTLNGIDMGGMTREQALSAIEQAYTVPISVTYAGEEIPPLLPEMVELSVDMEATAQNLDEAIATDNSPQAFMHYAIGRVLQRNSTPIEVNAVLLYSRERLDAYLERVAQKYDHAPMAPVALPEAGTFRPPVDGTKLNIETSLPLLVEGMLAIDPAKRNVALAVEVEPAPVASTDILSQALSAALRDFDGVAGIFAKDLRTGHELCLNCNVAYAGLSTLKIGIATELYRNQDAKLTDEHRTLIRDMLTEGDNAAANLLLSDIGAGDPYSGALKVTDFLWSLGMESSYMAGPYDPEGGALPPDIATPANTRTDITTDPNPYIQTTPTEMGLLLESIYQCTAGGGCLRALYPEALTPQECEELLAWMERNEDHALLSVGVPPEARVIHKHGWHDDTHADVALIYGPKSDFVVAAFLYQPAWQSWEESVPIFAQIGQLTYRFFNGDGYVTGDVTP